MVFPHFYQRIEIPTRWGDAWMYIVRAELCVGKKLNARQLAVISNDGISSGFGSHRGAGNAGIAA